MKNLFQRLALIVLASAFSTNSLADLLSLGATPALTTAPANGLQAVFGPFAGRSLACAVPGFDSGVDTLPHGRAANRICARVLADGTPQVGHGFNACTTWMSRTSMAYTNSAWDGEYPVRSMITTSGLTAWGSVCVNKGFDGDCTGTSERINCTASW